MRLRIAMLLLVAAVGSALAADPGRIIRTAELRAEPYSDAKVMSTLPADTPVSVLRKRGGWYEVETSGGIGWVRMTFIGLKQLQSGGGGSGDSAIGQVLSTLTTGTSGSSGVTAATGIKGISKAQMLNASPNYRGLGQLDQFYATARDAEGFAADGRLARNRVNYYQQSRSSSGTSTENNGGGFMQQEGGGAW